MPLFSSNKFLPKKTPQRKIGYSFPKRKPAEEDELKFEIDKIQLNVGDQNAVFEDGEWIPEGGVSGQRVKDHQRLRQHLQQVETENNFLKLKNEVLLDMDQKRKSKRHVLKDIPVNKLTSNGESSGRRPEQDAEQLRRRDTFEKMFPELKAKRESRERLEKIKNRCRSEADFEQVLEMLNEEVKMRRNAAEIPALRKGPSECNEECICAQSKLLRAQDDIGRQGQEIIDSFKSKNKKFRKKFIKYPKDFGKIARRLHRTVGECVYYYYLTKYKFNSIIVFHYKRWKLIRQGLFKRRTKYLRNEKSDN